MNAAIRAELLFLRPINKTLFIFFSKTPVSILKNIFDRIIENEVA